MATKRQELDEAISVRISNRDLDALKNLETLLPLKRITIARIALRLGIAALEEDPRRVIEGMEPARIARPLRSPKKPKRQRR